MKEGKGDNISFFSEDHVSYFLFYLAMIYYLFIESIISLKLDSLLYFNPLNRNPYEKEII